MGDAGPPTPPPILPEATAAFSPLEAADGAPLREVKVLVTGFGPFKSFLINPSWLVASSLPEELYPSTTSSSSADKPPPYKIKLIIYPSAIRVSYSTVSTLVPSLVRQHSPDLILHIGMAGGRDCYSLETRAHRDGYRIKDVDDADAYTWGEGRWKDEHVPDVLHVSWDEQDVLQRWEKGVQTGLAERGFLGTAAQEKVRAGLVSLDEVAASSHPVIRGVGAGQNLMWGTGNVPVSSSRADEHRRKGVVKLSCDAGRFLCEYALFESLSRRWLDAERSRETTAAEQQQDPTTQQASSSSSSSSSSPSSSDDPALALERVGKVAFLHVPGWTGVEDINRGVLVAEEAIRALVGSWEDGNRRSGHDSAAPARQYTSQHSEVAGRKVAVAGK